MKIKGGVLVKKLNIYIFFIAICCRSKLLLIKYFNNEENYFNMHFNAKCICGLLTRR